MDLNLSQEAVSINDIIFQGTLEQGVESDYVLPDYLPDITRVLKCKINSKIISKQLTGEKVVIDGYNIIKFYYLSEDLKKINSVEIKIPFNKTQDIKNAASNAFIYAKSRTDYCNCRVINQRRIDVRGAISVLIRIETQKSDNIINNAVGGNIELSKKNVGMTRLIGIVEKQFTQSEEFDLADDENDIESIIKSTGFAEITDVKLITNKIILKGNVEADLLCQSKSNYLNVFKIKKSLMFSQILELEGIDDECLADFKVEPLSIDAELSNYGNDDASAISINATLYLLAKGYVKTQTSVITDAYSTKYQTDNSNIDLMFEQVSEIINETSAAKETLDLSYEEIENVLDVSAEIDRLAYKYDKANIILTGNIIYSIIANNTSGEIVNLEKNTEFEITRPVKDKSELINFDGDILIKNVSISSFSNNKLDVRTEISLIGTVINIYKEKIISNISVNSESIKKQKNKGALIIYFADKDENLWEIAKNHNTSKQAIIDENSLDSEKLSARQMLLIPTA